MVAGSVGYHGAAVLAARGALRAQPGLVTLVVPEAVYLPIASQLQAVMVRPWRAGWTPPDSCSALLFGPGLAGEELPAGLKAAMVQLWKESPLPVLVDATGLDWLPAGATAAKALRVLTPHPGEAARLLGSTPAAVQSDRFGAIRDLAKRFGGSLVVLKGHQSLVGRNKGDVFINCSGNPGLAQGGSGDVLSGFLAGLLAQPALRANPSLTLRYGVWQHGAAADRLTTERANWTLEELIGLLGNVRPRSPGAG
jgi:NAD(P)H-hydrate epimerase